MVGSRAKLHIFTIFTFFIQYFDPNFYYHFYVKKFVEKFLGGLCYLHIISVAGMKISLETISKTNIFDKLDFLFYVSYFHMKTAPPMNIFDFFTLNCS